MIRMDFASLKETKPHEYALRFVFGGICTVLAGLIAKRYGPGLGGLFLAFPAIFPAGASLIESHEKKRKAQHGFDGTQRGRLAASIDAVGASLGCLGLMAFAFTLWIGLPRYNALCILTVATVVWLGVSTLLWAIHRNRLFHKRTTPADH
jgi:Protein of unknown function (DUF3147)